jgi:predicted GTPase
MLVLDEQMLGRDLDTALARWYRGPVLFITDLRPGTVIKDDAIPALLHQLHQATFLTINETDFWRKVAIDSHFCVVCFAVADSQAPEIATLLRAVLRLPPFRRKAQRMGKVLRVTHSSVSY